MTIPPTTAAPQPMLLNQAAGVLSYPAVDHTSAIVCAYVSHDPVSRTDLPALIAEVNKAVQGMFSPILPAAPEPELHPAVPVRKSVTPDYLICLDDGQKFKSLKRHLMILGMTPEQYRAKWGLPNDYPMVAPNYSAARSKLAKSIGLGKKGR